MGTPYAGEVTPAILAAAFVAEAKLIADDPDAPDVEARRARMVQYLANWFALGGADHE